MEGFRAIFQGVEDPRKSNAKKHDLTDMLVIALLATLSGWSSCSSFARYAKFKYEFLKGFLELKGGPPSHDAFSDLFNALDPEQLAGAMTELAKTLFAALPGEQVAIDGKVVKGAILDASRKSALHLVQAFAPGSGLVLGQVKVDGKSNVNAEVKFPKSAEVKFPTFSVFWRRARSVVGSGLLSGPASFFRRGRRRDERIRSDVFGNEVRVFSESVACAFDSDDDGVVEESVEECRRDDGVSEDVAPFREASVRCKDHRAFFVSCIYDLEEQACSAFGDGQVSDFIDDEQRGPSEEADFFGEPALSLGFGEAVGEFCERGFVDAFSGFDGGDAECCREVGLSGSGRSEEVDGFASPDEVELGQSGDSLAVE